jgi:hypothetical protein
MYSKVIYEPNVSSEAELFGKPWVIGYSNYGCLGTGEGYDPETRLWPVIDVLTNLNLPGWYKWAMTDSGFSFLIDIHGKMFCCGSNIYGELGIGEAMGESPPFPNYYTKTFVEVPGDNWDMVFGFFPNIIWALKRDGTLWVTGDVGGGIFGGSPINVWTETEYTGWLGGLSYEDTANLVLIKEVDGIYGFYQWDGGWIEIATKTIKELRTYYGSNNIREICAAGGKRLLENSRPFRGRDVNDTWKKNKNTLWYKEKNAIPVQIATGQWMFASGGSPNPDISGAGIMALKV